MKYLLSFLITILFGIAHGDWNAEYYFENSTNQQRWAKDFLDKFSLDHSKDIIDIGCGDGKITAYIAHTHPNSRVVGIDVSPNMILFARNAFSLENLSFEVKDASAIGILNEFDTAVSFCCLHWIQDKRLALLNIYNCLKEGGMGYFFLAVTYGKERIGHAMEIVKDKPRWQEYLKDYKERIPMITLEEFEDLANSIGFKVHSMHMTHTDVPYESREGFLHWLKGFHPYLEYVPENLHDVILNDIIDEYMNWHPIGEDGLLHYYDYFLETTLEKI